MENEMLVSDNIMVRARFLLPSLTKSEKKAAEFFLSNASDIIGMTLIEFAEKAGCSQASILRFCKRLGIDGFTDLKMKVIAQADEADNPYAKQEVLPSDSMSEILQKVFWYNIQTLKDTFALVSPEYDRALKALATAKAVHFFCVGDAVVPCQLANIKFRRMGLFCTVNADADMQLITASTIGKDDVAFAVSYTGSTRSVVEAMRLAKENGAKTICITKMEKSPMIKYCDIKLFTATTDVTVGKEIIARRIAEQAIMEALYLGLVEKERPDVKGIVKKTAEALEFNKL